MHTALISRLIRLANNRCAIVVILSKRTNECRWPTKISFDRLQSDRRIKQMQLDVRHWNIFWKFSCSSPSSSSAAAVVAVQLGVSWHINDMTSNRRRRFKWTGEKKKRKRRRTERIYIQIDTLNNKSIRATRWLTNLFPLSSLSLLSFSLLSLSFLVWLHRTFRHKLIISVSRTCVSVSRSICKPLQAAQACLSVIRNVHIVRH